MPQPNKIHFRIKEKSKAFQKFLVVLLVFTAITSSIPFVLGYLKDVRIPTLVWKECPSGANHQISTGKDLIYKVNPTWNGHWEVTFFDTIYGVFYDMQKQKDMIFKSEEDAKKFCQNIENKSFY